MVSDEAATRAIMRGICAPDRAARTLAATRLVEMMGGVEDSELFVARLLRAGVLLPLLRMAQCVKRNGDLSPHASCAEAAVHEADAGLIALSQLALLATEILARAGWEVVPDEDSGRLAFAHEATGVAQLATPSLPPVDGPTGGWARELLLDTISLVEPLEVNPASGEVRWPVRVISHECSISEHDSESAETWLQQCAAAVSVIDVAMDGGGEEQGATVRQLIRGVWRGVDGPRVAELDLAEEAGAQLETWEATTAAALVLMRLAAADMTVKAADGAGGGTGTGGGTGGGAGGLGGAVLILGLGGGTLAAFLQRHALGCRVDVVEGSAAVVHAAQEHFSFKCTLANRETAAVAPTGQKGKGAKSVAGSKRPRGAGSGGGSGGENTVDHLGESTVVYLLGGAGDSDGKGADASGNILGEVDAVCAWLDAVVASRTMAASAAATVRARYAAIVLDLTAMAGGELSAPLGKALAALADADDATIVVLAGVLTSSDPSDGGEAKLELDAEAARVRARADAAKEMLGGVRGREVVGWVDWQADPSLSAPAAELAKVHASVLCVQPRPRAGGGAMVGKGGAGGKHELKKEREKELSGRVAETHAAWGRTLARAGASEGAVARVPFTLDEVAYPTLELCAVSWAEADSEDSEDEEQDEAADARAPKVARPAGEGSKSGGSSAWSLFGDEEDDPRPSKALATTGAARLGDASFWKELARGTPGACSGGSLALRPPPDAGERTQLVGELETQGYLVYTAADGTGALSTSAADLRVLVRLMAVLRAHSLNLPPVFCFMYDATWTAVMGMWAFAEAVLGAECVLEPSVAAFKLDHAQTRAGKRYAGNNFGRPHRDYSRAEALDENGKARVLSVWLPLNDVTLKNGCMYVVPRQKDTGYEQADQGNLAPDVPLDGVRALAPYAAGTLMAWNGNVVHWGSACEREGALDPRASLALVFRRADVPPDPAAPPISRAEAGAMGTSERLRLVAKALGFFSAWYDVPKELAALLKEAL